MELSQLHLLLTYQCTHECDHCFVWGSPWQSGTMRLESIREILEQARDLGTVEWIYFEGGEPFLHYPILVRGVEAAAEMGVARPVSRSAGAGSDVRSVRELKRDPPFLQEGFRARQ
jgi:MoaA/NifB/PqqE/SkfB family radical SAM enzyme